MMSLTATLLFLLLMCLGLPIAASLGLAAGAVIWWYDLPLAVDSARHLRDHGRNLRGPPDARGHYPGAGDRGGADGTDRVDRTTARPPGGHRAGHARLVHAADHDRPAGNPRAGDPD